MARIPSEEKARNATSIVYEMMRSSSFMTGFDELDALSNSTSTISVHKTRAKGVLALFIVSVFAALGGMLV